MLNQMSIVITAHHILHNEGETLKKEERQKSSWRFSCEVTPLGLCQSQNLMDLSLLTPDSVRLAVHLPSSAYGLASVVMLLGKARDYQQLQRKGV